MPTYFITRRCRNDYADLNREQRRQFARARKEFVAGLHAWEEAGFAGLPQFPAHLRVKPLVWKGRQIMELAWAPDGRCTWEFGAVRTPGKCHVVWRRIGSHRIYEDP